MVRRLLEKGARVNEEDHNGHSALEVTQNGEMQTILKAAGGKPGSGKSDSERLRSRLFSKPISPAQ
jgi:hypothetical protein